jgi:hypothetical protein
MIPRAGGYRHTTMIMATSRLVVSNIAGGRLDVSGLAAWDMARLLHEKDNNITDESVA